MRGAAFPDDANSWLLPYRVITPRLLQHAVAPTHELARAQVGTLQCRFLKVAARVHERCRVIRVHLCSSFPFQALWEKRLQRWWPPIPGPAVGIGQEVAKTGRWGATRNAWPARTPPESQQDALAGAPKGGYHPFRGRLRSRVVQDRQSGPVS